MAMLMNCCSNVGGRLTGTIPDASFKGDKFNACISEACAHLTTNKLLTEERLKAAFQRTNGPALLAVDSGVIGAPIGPIVKGGVGRDLA